MDKKVTLTGFIVVPQEDIDDVKRALVLHKSLTEKESGCLVFTVTEDQNNHLRFNVYEEFINQAAFEHHQARIKTSQWALKTINVERHYQISVED